MCRSGPDAALDCLDDILSDRSGRRALTQPGRAGEGLLHRIAVALHRK
jgi:hypothetical protein